MRELSPQENQRYCRHFRLSGIGIEGQLKLKNARVLCVGAGALACVILPMLASAGVGLIGVADDDLIELSNLQRQTLYTTEDVGQKKIVAAETRLQELNPEISIRLHDTRVQTENAQFICEDYNFIVDCTDNFPSRYLLNAICVLQRKPFIYGGIFQFSGQCSVFALPHLPCYACLFPTAPEDDAVPNCSEAGVISSLPGIIGAIQANEVFKLILGVGKSLAGELLSLDALTMTVNKYNIKQRNNCEFCGNKSLPFDAQLAKIRRLTTQLCSEKTYTMSITEAALRINQDSISLLDVREIEERAIHSLGGYHIPLASLDAHLAELPNLRPLLVYCESGFRSQKAVSKLRQLGFECYHLEGGIRAWLLMQQ